MIEMPTTRRDEIFVVDDEPLMCDVLSTIFSLEGYRVTCFGEGGAFLAAARERTPAFVLLDVNMPGRNGLDLLREINARAYPAPILVVSGLNDIPTAIDAMRRGAFDFIEKPFDVDTVATRVRDTVARWTGTGRDGLTPPFPGHQLLTQRERDVLAQIASGSSNKEAGRTLRISPRTVEVHRARIMDKLGAKNAADLVRIVLCEAR